MDAMFPVSFGRDNRERSPRHEFLLIETFLLRLIGGGNKRRASIAIRLAHDIPARG
jgi:hypothetical protein